MKRIFIMLLLLAMVLPAFAGGTSESKKGPIVLPMLEREGGNDANTLMRQEIDERFSEKYKGRIELKIEYVPGDGGGIPPEGKDARLGEQSPGNRG